jgi:carbon storage regulator
MLVLSRKQGQKIEIGEAITLTVCHIQAGQVRIGIEAPKELIIVRPDVKERAKQEGWHA